MSTIGYIFFKGKKLSFNLNDFYVKVMESNEQVLFPEKLAIEKFAYGITEAGYPIVFQTGMIAYDHMHFTGFPVSFYAIDTANSMTHEKFDSFEKMQFCGGSLNYLIPPQAVYDDKKMFENRKNREGKEKSENYIIELLPIDKTIKKNSITIFGKKATYVHYPSFSYYSGKRTALIVNNVVEIKFNEPQPIELMQSCYIYMLRYISFLLGHQDVHFDNIYISKITNVNNSQKQRIAEVFVNKKHVGDGKTTADKTIKLDWFSEHIQNLISIYESKDGFNIDFLPNNEDERYNVSIDLIKQLCTALEIEYNLDNGEKPYNEIVKKLSKIVIKEVKAFKKENPELSKKFYDLIMTSIGKWGLPLADKIMYLYTANKTILDAFIKNNSWIQCKIDDIAIGKFVKARNNSTHGKNSIIEKEDINFIYLMKVLVYVLMMKRLGFEENKTIKIINRIF